ncbi:MAG: tetratricopeptide repeat protein [Pseudomonadota bacterium]|nr:tetratricopeptide repeat protein [Pseudomonadota bacterium]
MKALSCIAAFMISAVSINLQAAPYCGEINVGLSGGDYTNSEDRSKKLPIVEQYHFTPNIENLVKGNSGTLGAELSYTLEHFPNHHRALTALSKLALRDKTAQPTGAKYTVECFFDRAIRFKPRDSIVRSVYSNHLLKLGRSDAALEQLKEAINLQPENPTINYNLGLLYMQKKDYEQARTYAKKAYELGFPLPGLKNKLMEAGKWKD